MSLSLPVCLLLVMTTIARPGGTALLQSPRSGGAPPVPTAAGEREDDDLTVPVLPARRLVAATPTAPPPLPPGADRVRPLTLEVRVTTRAGGRAHTRAQTVTRAFDRVHVATATGVEWLFERNPVDPRRVSASAVQHAEKVIVVYSESDLRMALGIPGWTHVLTMGIDAPSVSATSSGPARTMAGMRFARAEVAADGRRGRLWWNADQLLPLEYGAADGTTGLAVVKIAAGADTARLAAPETRFPGYRVVELADWLEEH